MMRLIDIFPNSVTQNAANRYVGKIVFAASETSDTHSARDAIGRHLHQTVIVIFIGNYRRYRPRLSAMPGREGISAIEKLATLPASLRSNTLGDSFQGVNDISLSMNA